MEKIRQALEEHQHQVEVGVPQGMTNSYVRITYFNCYGGYCTPRAFLLFVSSRTNDRSKVKEKLKCLSLNITLGWKLQDLPRFSVS